jgi:hypothetical protein
MIANVPVDCISMNNNNKRTNGLYEAGFEINSFKTGTSSSVPVGSLFEDLNEDDNTLSSLTSRTSCTKNIHFILILMNGT